MKKSIFTLVLLSGFINLSIAQEEKATVNANDKMVKAESGIKGTPIEVTYIGFSNPPSDEQGWMPVISKISDNESEDEALLEKIKEVKERLRKKAAFQYGAPAAEAKTTGIYTPTVSTNFIGLTNGGSQTPLDNTIAISDSNYIVAFINSKVGYFNTTGTLTYSKSIYSLINDASIVNDICDPKVIYDNVAKRFIFYAQTCDKVAANSKVIIGFSKFQNPAAGWYISKLNGDPYNEGSFWDYPKMGVSTTELFVTGNLFDAAGGNFTRAVIYQIPKAPGFAGTPITSATKYTAPSGFTVVPAGKGQSGSYGPGIYLASTSGVTTGSTTVKLYQITNTVASGSAMLNTYNVATTSYSTAGNAGQLGSTIQLNTGDCRGQDAFYLNGFVHFVHNIDVGSGYAGLCYYRINVNTLAITRATYKVSGSDLGYPAIVSASNDSNDKSVAIAFNQVSDTSYPRTCVIGCDPAMNWSPMVAVKQGKGYVHYSWSTTATDRWGDYTGFAKNYGDPAASAWMAGMYGNTSHNWDQWIAKIYPASLKTTEVPTVIKEEPISASVYPNPILDFYQVKFDMPSRQKVVVNITDMQGKVVVELYNEIVEKGEKMLTFNRANLAPGVYLINIIGESSNIKNERIVIEGK